MSSTTLWYATRATGLMALVLLSVTMVLGITTTSRARARNWPGFAQQEMHRRISMMAVVFLGIHVLTSVLDTYVNISWAAVVIPFTSSYGRFWVGVGAIALDLMLAVFVTSLLRARMHAGTWRAVHWLAYLSWPVALAHTFGMGTDSRQRWVIVLGAACVAAVALALAWRLRQGSRQAAARTAHASVEGTPPKHLALSARTRWDRPVHSVSQAAPTTGRYRLLGHPTDLAGHVATLGPVPVPAGRAAGWREAFVSMLEASGLAGRGGAGFPAAIKLAVAHAAGGGGTIVVNAMEGEPASDKDKLLLLRAPHLVLDGAQLLAAASGAHRIVVAVPEGRQHVAAAVAAALAERGAAGCAPVGETLVRPPDRFVAGEESALARWVDSGSSLPTFRPDKGTALRIGRKGALVHNAETLAHVAMIARTGPDAFRAHGLVEDPGTSLVTISGAVEHPGVVEVDRGTPLIDIATRATPTGPPQALLVGGYGGSWVDPVHFTTPYASLSLRAIGATAGVGIVIVLGPDACGITETARIAHYLAGQSAGSADRASTGCRPSPTTWCASPGAGATPASCPAWSGGSGRSTAGGRAGIPTVRSTSCAVPWPSSRRTCAGTSSARPARTGTGPHNSGSPHRHGGPEGDPHPHRPRGLRRLRLLRRIAARGHHPRRVGLSHGRRQAAAPGAGQVGEASRQGLPPPRHHAARAQRRPLTDRRRHNGADGRDREDAGDARGSDDPTRHGGRPRTDRGAHGPGCPARRRRAD